MARDAAALLTRRELIQLGAASLALYACGTPTGPDMPDDYTAGLLTARPHAPTLQLAPGRHTLGLGGLRDGILTVPAAQPAPFLLLLHGAGGAASYFTPLLDVADELEIAALAVDARAGTWDVIVDDFGEDVAFIDSALMYVFDRVGVRADRIGIGGFSDGASYALSLGITNGDLFTHAIAWSPGFMYVPERRGKPHVFISHGTEDTVLPIDITSRRIVQSLRNSGFDVRYEEFAGGHTVPPALARAALEEFAGG